MANRDSFLAAALALITLGATQSARGIMAGDETALPADSPAARLDTLGSGSPFNAVGSLAISAGGFSYKGSATLPQLDQRCHRTRRARTLGVVPAARGFGAYVDLQQRHAILTISPGLGEGSTSKNRPR